MIALVNVDLNWAIGHNGDMQVYLKPDLKRFKEMTMGKAIIYGRKTLLTFPKQKPLVGRYNIILSRSKDEFPDSTAGEKPIVCSSIEEVIRLKNKLIEEKIFSEEEFVVCGGESVYKQLLEYIDKAYVTKMNTAFEADAYFCNLDLLDDWKIVNTSEKMFDQNIEYQYVDYERIK